MKELILHPNEPMVLQPGERIEAGAEPLRIRCGTPNVGTNAFSNMEEMLWASLKRSSGNQTAVYRRGPESRLVYVVPETAKADSFGYDDLTLTTTSRIFKVGKADLAGWLPEHGDTLDYNNTVYTVKNTSNANNTFYQDVGNHGVMIRIIVTEYRN
jgi:hypothetical protein